METTNTLQFLKKLVRHHVLGEPTPDKPKDTASIDHTLFNQLVYEHRLEFIVNSKIVSLIYSKL